MNFNTIVKINHLEELAEEFSYFYKINYKLNYGARYKWSRIWSMIKKLGLLDKNFTCIDLGGGLSPIHFILSNYGKIINIDYSGFKASWFPVNSQGFYTKSIGLESKMRNIFYIKDDFLQYVKGINDNSIDFIIDGCSFIHFNPTKIISHNDGIISGMKQIDRVLKPGGHFISCSDVAHPLFPENQDMIHPEHLGECFTSSGLNYISEPDWDLEHFFMDKKNFHITNKKGPGYLEQTEQGCTTCRGLPDYHYFTHGYYRNIILSVSSYTLEKKRNHIKMNNTDNILHNMNRSKQLISQIKWKFLRVLYRILWLREIKKMVKPKIIYSLHYMGIYDLVKKILRKSNKPTSGGY